MTTERIAKLSHKTVYGNVLGGKGATTDAGTHVPLIVRWPGRVKPGLCEDLVDSTDFLPTILEAADNPIAKESNIDGISFFPQLTGKAGRKREWTFCHYDPRPGWDKDKFGLVRYARTRRFKLYDTGPSVRYLE